MEFVLSLAQSGTSGRRVGGSERRKSQEAAGQAEGFGADRRRFRRKSGEGPCARDPVSTGTQIQAGLLSTAVLASSSIQPPVTLWVPQNCAHVPQNCAQMQSEPWQGQPHPDRPEDLDLWLQSTKGWGSLLGGERQLMQGERGAGSGPWRFWTEKPHDT